MIKSYSNNLEWSWIELQRLTACWNCLIIHYQHYPQRFVRFRSNRMHALAVRTSSGLFGALSHPDDFVNYTHFAFSVSQILHRKFKKFFSNLSAVEHYDLGYHQNSPHKYVWNSAKRLTKVTEHRCSDAATVSKRYSFSKAFIWPKAIINGRYNTGGGTKSLISIRVGNFGAN